MTTLLIHIDHITAGGLNIECEERPQAFPVLAELSEAGEVEFLGRLEIQLRMDRMGELISVAGRFKVPARLSCSRCLAFFETALSRQFEIIYIQQATGADNLKAEAEIELNREDLNAIFFQGEEIDLRPAVEEQVVMGLPMKSLCRVTCRGICVHCGSDLNRGDCGCRKEPLGSSFAALKDFKTDR